MYKFTISTGERFEIAALGLLNFAGLGLAYVTKSIYRMIEIVLLLAVLLSLTSYIISRLADKPRKRGQTAIFALAIVATLATSGLSTYLGTGVLMGILQELGVVNQSMMAIGAVLIIGIGYMLIEQGIHLWDAIKARVTR